MYVFITSFYLNKHLNQYFHKVNPRSVYIDRQSLCSVTTFPQLDELLMALSLFQESLHIYQLHECVSTLSEMRKLPGRVDLLHVQYYSLNARLLSTIGLLPDEANWLKWMKNIYSLVILFSSLIFQVAAFVNRDYSMRNMLNDISIFIVTLGCTAKYLICLYQRDAIGVVLSRMRNNWAAIETKGELDIYTKCAWTGKFHTLMISLSVVPMGFVMALGQYMPIVLDVIVPLNDSRSRELLATAYFFFDQERYFHVAVLIIDLIVIIVALVFISTECFTIAYIQHACGLFEVARYRLSTALKIEVKKKLSEASICRAIKRAAVKHSEAYEFTAYLAAEFVAAYLIMIMLGVSALALSLYHLSQSIVSYRGLTDLLFSGIISGGTLIYMFYLNYMCQQAIDQCMDILPAIYDTEWYKAPLSVQKLLLFIRLKSMKPAVVSVFGVYNASMEGFSSIARLSLSYFTMLHSYQ